MRRNLHLHPVSRPYSHKVQLRSTRRVNQHQILIGQLHAHYRARQQLNNLTLDGHYGRVNTHGPFAVTATQCSK